VEETMIVDIKEGRKKNDKSMKISDLYSRVDFEKCSEHLRSILIFHYCMETSLSMMERFIDDADDMPLHVKSRSYNCAGSLAEFIDQLQMQIGWMHGEEFPSPDIGDD
jgi:hypothetical protein